MHWFTRFLKAERGVAAIEAAFAFPVLIYATVVAIDLAMMMLTQVTMEGAAREAARYGITGYTVSGKSRPQFIRDIVTSSLPRFVKSSDVVVSQLSYKSFEVIGKPEPYTDANHNGNYDLGETFNDINGNGKWDPDMGAEGAGGPGDVVVYTITTTYRFPLAGFGLPLTSTLKAKVVMRNEPFPQQSDAAPPPIGAPATQPS